MMIGAGTIPASIIRSLSAILRLASAIACSAVYIAGVISVTGNTQNDMVDAVDREAQAQGISLPTLKQSDYTAIVPESLLKEFENWGRVVAAKAGMSFGQIFALAASFKAAFIAGTAEALQQIDAGGRQSFQLSSLDASTVQDVDAQIEEALLAEIQY